MRAEKRCDGGDGLLEREKRDLNRVNLKLWLGNGCPDKKHEASDIRHANTDISGDTWDVSTPE